MLPLYIFAAIYDVAKIISHQDKYDTWRVFNAKTSRWVHLVSPPYAKWNVFHPLFTARNKRGIVALITSIKHEW
jgi:hypothetical protein